jgi:iron complex outermembrane receptor protein
MHWMLYALLQVAVSGSGQAALRVEVVCGATPLAGAAVVAGEHAAITDPQGVAVLAIPPGKHTVSISLDGYLTVTAVVELAAGAERVLQVEMRVQPEHEETITVSATRTNMRLEDQPMRVEVLDREEIEEKMLMTPGDIVMMLNEMGGMRVQSTSPSLGAASVRIQGLRGRYTRVLSDGLPLYGQQVGGLGLLQIPPMDLGQVEVIKGTASALYGAGAMGGVIDLVSRRPPAEPERELLFNRTSRGGTDVVGWLASPLSSRWSATLLAGGHWQDDVDVDDDAWADLSSYSRAVVRPRVFWEGDRGRSFFATAGVTFEDRTGGTVDDEPLPQLGAPYVEALDTRRFDVGAVATAILRKRFVVTARAAATRQRHSHRFQDILERDRHLTLFGEVAVRGSAWRHTWVAGAALEHDDYDPRDVTRFAYTYTVPGIFLQDDMTIAPWVSLSVSGRLDEHSEYGRFVSPRVSALFRHNPWSARISGGTGFFAPTALTEETEAAGLTRLDVPRPLLSERGRSMSLDITRTDGPASYTLTLFGSRVRNPVTVFRSTSYALVNLPEPSTHRGVEALVTFRQGPLVATATYTFVRSRETGEEGARVETSLTPRHSAGLVGMLETEAGRIGLEIYYTGAQRLEANPYRTRSAAYAIVGLLGEKRFNRWRLFVNGENLTGVRQSNFDPLTRPSPSIDGRWTVDAWAPLDGRVVNGGVRIDF